jgi:AraC family transcriptional regulator, regulatory protein of adaptative response / methylated-DNA-[protein]-cysteine methyltransferase
LVKAIEDNLEKRWKEQDFRALSIDVSTARRQFKKRFGMTFVEYARARRMGLALKNIKEGNSIIDTQLSVGYESSSGFRDAFSKIMGAAPTRANDTVLKSSWLDTRVGPMIVIADENTLYLLEFIDRRGLENEVKKLREKHKAAIIPGETPITKSIASEISNYFEGKEIAFKTPIHFIGSSFQKSVWKALIKIPAGETRSYAKIAKSLNAPTAYRAVARANGANQLAIIVPCHRVINSNGELGGYGGGVVRKEWLLEHERKFKEKQFNEC